MPPTPPMSSGKARPARGASRATAVPDAPAGKRLKPRRRLYDSRRHGTPTRDAHGPAEEAAAWLRAVLDEGDIVEIFAKGHEGERRVGYYDVHHLEQLGEQVSGLLIENIYYTLNRIDPGLLDRAPNRQADAGQIGRCSRADVRGRRLLLVDVDPVRPSDAAATRQEKRQAELLARRIEQELAGQHGWPAPAVIASGNGVHLIYRLDLPVDDDGLVRRVLRGLHAKYGSETVAIDTGVHDPARLARLPGTWNRKGEPSDERPHRPCYLVRMPAGGLTVVRRDLLEQVAEPPPAATTGAEASPGTTVAAGGKVLQMAEAYIATMPPAISGQRGHDATFSVACRLIIGFGLSVEQALPIMLRYNQRCQPPWSEAELRRKLEQADTKAGQTGEVRGRLRLGTAGTRAATVEAGDPRYAGWEPLDGPGFMGYVPDLADADAASALAGISAFARIRWIAWSAYFIAWRMQRARVLIPEPWLRQVWWGGQWPRNWRPALRSFSQGNSEVDEGGRCERDACILRGCGRHGHWVVHGHWGPILEQFAEPQNTADSSRVYRLYDSHNTKKRNKLRRRGELAMVYWPALLFGYSPRIAWNTGQVRLLVGLVRELTRDRSGAAGPGGAQVIQGNQVAAAGKARHLVTCPLLAPDMEYVTFGGNGRLAGRGYRIVGDTSRGWLHRAGYPDAPPKGRPKRRQAIIQWLDHLARLADDLDLTVVGYASSEPPRLRWWDLAMMQQATRTAGGMERLEAMTVRIYARADWLTRWRYFFSRRMGFRWIPASPDDPGPGRREIAPAGEGPTIATPADLRRLLAERGWTQQDLAAALSQRLGRPVSRQRVSRHLRGEVASDRFYEAVNDLHPPPG